MRDNSRNISPIIVTTVFILFVVAFYTYAFADIYDGMQVVKISPQEEWAIMKTCANDQFMIPKN